MTLSALSVQTTTEACTSPPSEPRLSHYGAGFADFLASFPPADDLRWLVPIARLDEAPDQHRRVLAVLTLLRSK